MVSKFFSWLTVKRGLAVLIVLCVVALFVFFSFHLCPAFYRSFVPDYDTIRVLEGTLLAVSEREQHDHPDGGTVVLLILDQSVDLTFDDLGVTRHNKIAVLPEQVPRELWGKYSGLRAVKLTYRIMKYTYPHARIDLIKFEFIP